MNRRKAKWVVKIEQSIRYIQGADIAILFIHGILGTPDHFKPFLSLVPPNWSIYNILLKGHGGSVKDFAVASMAEWKQQIHETLQTLLATHSKVIIVAHSMGTLFAIQEAIDNPIAALFLLNVPLKVRIRFQLLKTSWKVFRGNIKSNDVWSLAAQSAYGIDRDTHILRYIGWLPRYIELFSEIRKTRKIAYKLTTPCQVYLSLKDEMVSPKTGKLFEKNPCVTVKTLNSSGHYYYSSGDQQLLHDDFCDMINRLYK